MTRLVAMVAGVISAVAAVLVLVLGLPSTPTTSAIQMVRQTDAQIMAPVVSTTRAVPTTLATVFTTSAEVASTSTTAPQMVPPSEADINCRLRHERAISIPVIGLCESIVDVDDQADGFHPLPDVVSRYSSSYQIGEGKMTYLSAHVDQPNGNHVFLYLHELQTGDVITVWHAGIRYVYRVDTVTREIPKGLMAERYNPVANALPEVARELWVVTCDDPFIPEERSYASNLLVRASLWFADPVV